MILLDFHFLWALFSFIKSFFILRESQRLVESSSHMSSAALTELLANLTSQPSEESESNMEVDFEESPLLHSE